GVRARLSGHRESSRSAARVRKRRHSHLSITLSTFVPRNRLRNGHLMTVFAWARPREFTDLPAAEERLFAVTDDTQVLAHCYWQRERASHPVLLALHGLEGSSSAHYMRGL